MDHPVSFRIPDASGGRNHKDTNLRRHFYNQLDRQPPHLEYEGYIRALQLYGNESQFERLTSVWDCWTTWASRNPATHREFQNRAIHEGYDPENGTVDAGVYTSHTQMIADVPPVKIEESPRRSLSAINVALPGSQSRAQSFSSGDQRSSNHRGMSLRQRGPDGRFRPPSVSSDARLSSSRQESSPEQAIRGEAVIPLSLENLNGNLHWVDGDIPANSVGVANIAAVTTAALQQAFNRQINDAGWEEVGRILTFLGGAEGIRPFTQGLAEAAATASGPTSQPQTPIFGRDVVSERPCHRSHARSRQ